MSRINTSHLRGSSGHSASAPSAAASDKPESAEKPFKAVLQVAQQQAVESKKNPQPAVQSRDGKGRQSATEKTDDAAKTAAEKAQPDAEQLAETAAETQPKPQTAPRAANSAQAPRNRVVASEEDVAAKPKPASQQLNASAATPVDERGADQKHDSRAGKDNSKSGKSSAQSTDPAAQPAVVTTATAVAPVLTVVHPPVQSNPAGTNGSAISQQPSDGDVSKPAANSGSAAATAAKPAAAHRSHSNTTDKPASAPQAASDAPNETPANTSATSTAAEVLPPQTTIVPAPIASAEPVSTAAPAQPPVVSAAAPLAHPSVTPEAAFVAANHPPIVMGVHGQLLPDGGTMNIRLAPPELGDLQISVQVNSGSLAASFQTSNDQATRLLSHSLGQLKSALETAGVSVERLQVAQMPRGAGRQESNSPGSRDPSSQDKTQADSEAGARDQQRRELLRRMWAKVSGKDDLDLVA